MNQRALNSLEFVKILELLQEQTGCDLSRDYAVDLRPISNIQQIKHWHTEVDEAVKLIWQKGSPHVGGLIDVSTFLQHAEKGGTLSTKELLAIARSNVLTRGIIKYHNSVERECYSIDVYFDQLINNRELEDAITNAIIAEETISDNASDTLGRIRRSMRKAHEKIRQTLDGIIHSSTYQKYLQECIITQRNGRYVVPVKADCKGAISGIIHDVSASGITIFVEPNSVVQINNQLRELESAELDEIERILTELSQKTLCYSETILINQRVMAEMDLIFAKARLSIAMDASTPRINDTGRIKIKRGRHPLIDVKKVVPIDIELGEDIKTIVVTGPNTGGKTVLLKTIGIFCLMTASGLQIPASQESEIPVFNKIFADIGDEQSIEQSLSTFSAHMTNIVNIVNNVNDNTLVLFDELGAGTDPVEGAALAIAILEYMREVGVVSIATTHYSELKSYAIATAGVQNAGCEFDIDSLQPTYKVILGIPGKSNAFAISSRLGLSEYILQKAEERLTKDVIQFEDIISELERNRRKLDKDIAVAEAYKESTKNSTRAIEEERNRLIRDKEKEIQAAKRQAKEIMLDAKREAQKIIEELREAQKSKIGINKAIGTARNQLGEKIGELDEKGEIERGVEYGDAPETVEVGDKVFLLDINQEATVMSKPDKKGMVKVAAGVMNILRPLSKLRVITKATVKNKSNLRSTTSLGLTTPEIDLRGLTLEDAVYTAEKFIDNAVISGLSQIVIIHGKGTGVLRRGMHDMLKNNKHIKNYRLGQYGEGEDGVTMVELK